MLDECLTYDVINIRTCAIAAIPAFLTEYYSGVTAQDSERRSIILNNYIGELSTSNQVTRMGYALALGAIPAFMLRPHLDDVINSLISTTVITLDTLKWAESRRDAVKALTSVCVALEDDVDKGTYFFTFY